MNKLIIVFLMAFVASTSLAQTAVNNKEFKNFSQPAKSKYFDANYIVDNWESSNVQVVELSSANGIERQPVPGSANALMIHSGGYIEQQIAKPTEKKIRFKACSYSPVTLRVTFFDGLSYAAFVAEYTEDIVISGSNYKTYQVNIPASLQKAQVTVRISNITEGNPWIYIKDLSLS